MGFQPNNQTTIFTAAVDSNGHLTFSRSDETQLTYQTKNTCGMSWKVSQVTINGNPIQNWFSTTVTSSDNQTVFAKLKFDFAAFNLSSLTNGDRALVEDAWRRGTQIKVRITFVGMNTRDDVYVTLTH